MGQGYTYTIGISRNGRQAYVGIINSPAGRYFGRQPYLLSVVKDLLLTLDLAGSNVITCQDMGRAIGNTHIVATNAKDAVFYARPPKKTNSLRFVKNRSMEPSRELSLVLRQDNDGDYEIVNIWIGPLYPPFPDADDANNDSKAYWQHHAFTAGSEPIDLQTVTRIAPISWAA